MTMTTTQTTDLDALNELLRGEMSAIETYRQALEAESSAQDLHHFAQDHRDAADQLWHHVEQHGGQPSEGSGPWGSWAKVVEGTAKLFGNAASLKALKEGEEHGLKSYQSALENEDMAPECLTLIRNLADKQREHITGLDRLIAQA